MTPSDLQALLPHIVVAATAVAVMLVISFYRNQTVSAVLTVAGLFAAAACLPFVWSAEADAVPPLFRVDPFGCFHIGLLLTASVAVTVFSHSYLEKYRMERGEFYILLLLSVLGALVLTVADHFISFFLGLELLSVSLYVMVAYIFTKKRAVEAGVKYLFLAAATSAFLLFGMALIYAELGTMAFPEIAAELGGGDGLRSPYLLAGTVLVVAGAGFKLSVVPFHMWTPDIYQGAPAPVTAFLATVSKACVVVVLLRFLAAFDSDAVPGLYLALTVVACASMLTGNLLALLQDNIKRILAYSSIAHFGYLLVAFVAGGPAGAMAATFYLVTYFAATLVAFGVVAYLSPSDREADTVADYRGLFWSRPGPAALLSLALFSLVGLPLTGGFMGKFFLVGAGAEARLWTLLLVLAVSSAISIYYYLRVVVAMYSSIEDTPQTRELSEPFAATPPYGNTVGAVQALLALGLLVLGLYPQPVLAMIQSVTRTF